MAGKVNSVVLDNGLLWLQSKAGRIYICSQEPLTFADATVAYALGMKDFGAGGVTGAPVAGSPNGRKVTTNAVTDGTVSGSGTATRWAIVDWVNSVLLADNDLAASQPVTAGNVFSLPAFDIRLPSS